MERAGTPATRSLLAIVRAVTAIDEDGDAAWRVLAVTSETHSLGQALVEWSELAATPASSGEDGVGVASPLLFVALGPPRWARQQGQRLRREAADLLSRLRLGETDLGDELAWLTRPLRARGARFNATTWRALALRELLAGDEPAQPTYLEGEAGDDWLSIFYSRPPGANEDETEALAGRALEAWLALLDASADEET